VLEVAVEYGMIDRNPARGRKRRLKAGRPAPVWLDSAEQIAALLDAASELDQEAPSNRQVPRRAIVATLTLAGRRITVRESKTDAGALTIDVLPALGSALRAHEAAVKPAFGARVFPTQGGGPSNASNVRNRILARAVERANERLEQAGATPLPASLTPHKLRHTYASVLVALGTDVGAVMDQLGPTDAGFTFRVYRHGMRRGEDSRTQLARLVGADPAVKRQRKGSSRVSGRDSETVGNTSDAAEQRISGLFPSKRRTGVEPATSSLGSASHGARIVAETSMDTGNRASPPLPPWRVDVSGFAGISRHSGVCAH